MSDSRKILKKKKEEEQDLVFASIDRRTLRLAPVIKKRTNTVFETWYF